jgi:uracil-DNA glycosylase
MNRSKSVQQAFFSIARCKNAAACFADASHPCATIVRSQKASDIASFQLPEPWVGEIDVAPILFVASNPSIGEDEHAMESASDEEVWDSHHFAFGGGKRTYISDGIRTTDPDGSIIKPVRYWASVRARARELLSPLPLVYGKSYAMTEIVHCKSIDEIGVAAAAETCAAEHLENVLGIAAAVVVVAMGAVAHQWLGASKDGPRVFARMLGGRERLVAALPHPSARGGPKSFAANLTPAEMARLREAVGQAA